MIRNIKQLISTSPETINVQTDIGDTSLHWASTYDTYDNTGIVELLLEHNADPNLQNKNGYTALHMAYWKGNTEIVELLLEHNVDPNLQNKYRNTALHRASLHCKKKIVELLLEHCADPNLQDINGYTALYWASQHSKKDIVKLLLEHGADPNLQDINGYTSLYWASKFDKKGIKKLLLEAWIIYPIKKAHEQSVFIEKVNFMKKYVNIKIKLVNNEMYNYSCL